MTLRISKINEAFLAHRYINWNNACGDKSGGVMSILKFMYCVEAMTKTQIDVANLLSTECEKHRAINCAYLQKVLENAIFLARRVYQGKKLDIS